MGRSRKRALRKLPDWDEHIAGETIIRTALAHALFDADPVLYAGFAHTVYDLCPKPCDAPLMLAQLIVAELEYARYEVIETRQTPREAMTPIKGRMELVDHIRFALDFGGRVRWAKLGDPDPKIAHATRGLATKVIHQALSIACVRLGRRKP